MATSLALSMQVTANTQGLAKATKDVEKLMKKMEKSVQDTQKTLKKINLGTSFLALNQGIGLFVGALKKAYGSLNQFVQATAAQENELIKVQQVFGDAAASVEEFAKITTLIGISETAALSAAGTFGNLFTSLGSGSENAAKLSVAMVGLSADIAAFSNVSVERATTALQASLAGISLPLRRLGFDVRAAEVELKALELGLIQTKGQALDPYAKSLATVAVIMEKTANAQGQAIREAKTYGQVMRVITASVGDLAGSLGETLLPIFRAIGQGFINALPAMQRFTSSLSAMFKDFDWVFLTALVEGLAEGFADFALIVGGVLAGTMYFFGEILKGVQGLLGLFGKDLSDISALIRPLATALAPVLIGLFTFKVGALVFAQGAAIYRAAMLVIQTSIPGWGQVALALAAVSAIFISIGLALSETAENSEEAMDKLTDVLKKGSDAVTDGMGNIVDDYQAAQEAVAKPFQFKLEGVTEQSISQSILGSVDSAYAKLAQQAGGVGLVNEEVQAQYEEYQNVLGVVNRLIESGLVQAKDYQYLNEEAQKLLDLAKKQTDELKKQDEAAKALAKSYEEATRVVEKLVDASLSPSQNTAREYAEQMEAVSLYLRKAQDDLNSARAAGDAAAITAAEKQLALAEKNSKIAAGQAEKQRKESYLENLGFNIEDFKEQTQEIDKLAAVVQEFNKGILTGSEVRNYVENTANDVIDWFRQIKEQTQEIADENLKAMDTRTAEGLEEFFRLATGQDDPALEAEREQVAQLKKINRQLKGTGLTVAKIAGA